MVIVYICGVLSIMIQKPFYIELPGLGSNYTGLFTGLSAETFRENLNGKSNEFKNILNFKINSDFL